MAYCKSCGAYIPDGQTKCLACGYDEAAQAAQEQARPDNTSGQTDGAAAGAYQNAFAYRDNHEDLKHRLEEQRRAQQEAQRRLAEQEYARRKKQEEDRRWAQQEYERRQEEKRRQEQENANRFAQDAARYTYRSQTSAQPNKMLAALSYLGLGVPDNVPTWGNIINAAKRLDIVQTLPMLWLAPAAAICLFVLSINFFGDGLRDALDPSSK